MFDEKIKLNLESFDNTVTRLINGQEFKFNKYLEQEFCKVVINECLDRFIEVNNENKDYTVSIMSVLQTMNISLCYLTTNIDIENISYEDLSALGVFKTIEDTLINYSEIKSNVIMCVSLMFDYVIYNAIESLPSTKQMTDNLEELKEIFTSNPEKAKEYANIVMTNHPELKGFGEIFEKILNNINKKE